MRGTCLCGGVRWSIEGRLTGQHACHCSICRKMHGTGYGAYASLDASGFEWIAGREWVASFRTSKTGERSFCSRCGSPVPYGYEGSLAIALGSIEDPFEGMRIKGHLLAGSKAPWFTITDGLPQRQELT